MDPSAHRRESYHHHRARSFFCTARHGGGGGRKTSKGKNRGAPEWGRENKAGKDSARVLLGDTLKAAEQRNLWRPLLPIR